MPVFPVGEGVLLYDDERLDIVDVVPLQANVYEQLARTMGGLMGECSGVLTDVTFNTSNPAAVSVGACTLCGFRPVAGSDRLTQGVVIDHNPASPYQSPFGSLIPTLAPYVSGQDKPYIWFARAEVQADMRGRKEFQGGLEKGFSPLTRLRQYVRFERSISRTVPPNTSYDWYVFAQVASWDAGIPTIVPISPFDGQFVPATDVNVSDGLDRATAMAASWLQYQMNQFGSPAPSRLGEAEVIRFINQRLMSIIDPGWTFDLKTGETLTRGVSNIGTPIPAGGGVLDSAAHLAGQPLTVLRGIINAGSSLGTIAGVTKRTASTGVDARVDVGQYVFYVPNAYTITGVEVVLRETTNNGLRTIAQYGCEVTPGSPDHIVTVWTSEIREALVAAASDGDTITAESVLNVDSTADATGQFQDGPAWLVVETTTGLALVKYTTVASATQFGSIACAGGGVVHTNYKVRSLDPCPAYRGFIIEVKGVLA